MAARSDDKDNKTGFAPDDVREHYDRLAIRYEAQANQPCRRAYTRLVRSALAGSERVLELGTGAGDTLDNLDAREKFACDLSAAMLRNKSGPGCYVQTDAGALPYSGDSFDGVFCINMLEHVPDVNRVMAEIARVLAPNGRLVVVTPNGDLEWLLDRLEQAGLKLPEGPHRYVGFKDLYDAAAACFNVIEHRRFLAFPAGPDCLVRTVDRMFCGYFGLFQYLCATRGNEV